MPSWGNGSSPRAWSRQLSRHRKERATRFISTCVEQTVSALWRPRLITVHLHVRGADIEGDALSPNVRGSSPRAWSRRARSFVLPCVHTVHLHVRGADAADGDRADRVAGSSPRAWSRHPSLSLLELRQRFISTCVEQTNASGAGVGASAVHLHVRGADMQPVRRDSDSHGSSPRAWSRQQQQNLKPFHRRFISTCVEQTIAGRLLRCGHAVHLHVRGADLRVLWVEVDLLGSSPRAWSRLGEKLGDWRGKRFISTCVEQTCRPCATSGPMSVHLHVRGADGAWHEVSAVAFGSSPRAWSRPCFFGRDAFGYRFISTCVEQTPCVTQFSVYPSVHLHVRGADDTISLTIDHTSGSSPRAWSRHPSTGMAAWYHRFISTCVEQTAARRSRPARCAVHLHVRGADGTEIGVARARDRFISTCVEQTRSSSRSTRWNSVHLHVRGADPESAGEQRACCGSSPRAWSRPAGRLC